MKDRKVAVIKRDTAFAWVQSLMGLGNCEPTTWQNFISEERILAYAGDNLQLQLAVKWGVEEGAIAILQTIFNISDEELDVEKKTF